MKLGLEAALWIDRIASSPILSLGALSFAHRSDRCLGISLFHGLAGKVRPGSPEGKCVVTHMQPSGEVALRLRTSQDARRARRGQLAAANSSELLPSAG
jgi:hypothetical protein